MEEILNLVENLESDSEKIKILSRVRDLIPEIKLRGNHYNSLIGFDENKIVLLF